MNEQFFGLTDKNFSRRDFRKEQGKKNKLGLTEFNLFTGIIVVYIQILVSIRVELRSKFQLILY